MDVGGYDAADQDGGDCQADQLHAVEDEARPLQQDRPHDQKNPRDRSAEIARERRAAIGFERVHGHDPLTARGGQNILIDGGTFPGAF